MTTSIKVPEALSELYNPSPKTKVFYGGRGGAKSTAIAESLLVSGMQSPLRILCAREIQKSITLSVYSLLKDKITQHRLDWFYNVQSDKIIGANGTEFFFVGLQGHTVDSLKSIERINRCWVEEAHNVSDKSWEILIPSLFRVDDCQLIISFNTRKITDPTYIRFVQHAHDDPNILCKKVGWQDNPWFPDGMNEERLKLKKLDYEAYLHVWEGEPDTRHNGSVYAKWVDRVFSDGRVKKGIYNPDLPVMTAWDLGWSDNTSIIFFQVLRDELRIIDCYESFNEDIPHYARVILDKPYTYSAHYMPHDAINKLLQSGGRSIAEIARQCGIEATVIPETTHAQRIEAARKVLGNTWFDSEKSRDLVNALMNYNFKYNDDLKTFSTKPVHDWSSHYSTAFELLARVFREQIEKKEKPKHKTFSFESGGNGHIIGRIDTKAYFKKKARERR